MTFAVMQQLSGKPTQTEQGRIRLALSWDFTQLLTFSRTSENGHISKKLNPEVRAGRKAGMKIWTFGTGSTHFNETEKDPSDVGGRVANGPD
jgi:hypothetical protein